MRRLQWDKFFDSLKELFPIGFLLRREKFKTERRFVLR
jgi:hypothetical protein